MLNCFFHAVFFIQLILFQNTSFWSLVGFDNGKLDTYFVELTKYMFIRVFKITWILFYFNFLVKHLPKNLQLLQQTRKLPATNFILYILTDKKHKPLYFLIISLISNSFYMSFLFFLVYFLSSHKRNKKIPPLNQHQPTFFTMLHLLWSYLAMLPYHNCR